MSSITKKNRPSYVFLIDCREERSSAVEALIPEELGSGGWHRISTEHHFLYNRAEERTIRIKPKEGAPGPAWKVKGKWFENGSLRPEHESVIELQEAVYDEFGIHAGYSRLYHIIMSCLEQSGEEEIVISL